MQPTTFLLVLLLSFFIVKHEENGVEGKKVNNKQHAGYVAIGRKPRLQTL